LKNNELITNLTNITSNYNMPIPQLSRKTKSPQNWKKREVRRPSATSSVRQSIQRSRQMRERVPLSSLQKTKRRYTKRRKLDKKTTMNLILMGMIGILVFLIFSFLYVLWLSRDLPDPNKLIDRSVAESTKIYDRTGETILYEVSGDEKRTIIKLEEMPDYLKWATISAEDRTFYEHHGFNILAMIKGVIIDPLTGKPARGGSTLTQQLVKNAILSNERKISRKIREFILSYRIENKFSKDEILQMYLNEIPYGSTAYGIESAARKYFGLHASELNLAQTAVLAALPKAPTYYSPYGTHKDKLINRQEWILNAMEELGYITTDELEEAMNTQLEFLEPRENIIAPHFVMYVRELLSEDFGDVNIEQEGYKIYTTLDLYKQEIAEEILEERGEKNDANYNASNGALVSIDPKTGEILAMVGSRDYFNDDIDGQVNVGLSLRQPGSSLKPLVYASFFNKGYTPNTILYDVVTDFAIEEEKTYEPHNYDLKEHGAVTARKALAGSLNIPAVKALYLTGNKNVTDQAQAMGYSSLDDPDRYGLSLVLGGGEVRLLDHTAAFGVFAREGEYHKPRAILKIEDRKGRVIKEYDDEKEKRVIPVNTTRMINDILSDNNERAYAFGESNWLTLRGRPAAAKTGTTNDYRDAWTIGYTPSLVTGVWVGNNDNSEMKKGAAGGVVAAPIWNQYMQRVLGNTPIETFKEPEIEETGKAVLDGQGAGEIKIKVDKITGLLATENTPPELIEEKTFRSPHSILYYVNKNDPRGPIPEEGKYDVQFPVWEEAIKKWAEENEIELDEIPTELDEFHKPENIPNITVHYPKNNIVVTTKLLTAQVSASANLGMSRVEYYIDNYLIEMVTGSPYHLSTDISFLTNGSHQLTIKACDKYDNCKNENRQFNLVLDDSQRDNSISLGWVSPNNNSTISQNSFPLAMKILTLRPSQITNIKFYYLNERDSAVHLITTNSNISTNEPITYWQDAPAEGGYYLYAEAKSTSGSIMKTKKVKVNIGK